MKFSITLSLFTLTVGRSTAQTATQVAVDQAKVAIINLIETTDDVNLAPKFVRLAFHDCVGGCDGCVDVEHFDNFGLRRPIESLQPIVSQFASQESGLSRADIWVLAGLTGAEISQRNDGNQVDFPLTLVGRPVCEDNPPCLDRDDVVTTCTEFTGPHRVLPSPDLTTDELLHYFSETFRFSPQETVAIMGVHTIGVTSRLNSGFDGPNGWVRNEERLDNDYYRIIVGGDGPDDTLEELIDAPNWQREIVNNEDIPGIPNRFQWERNEGGGGGRGRGQGRNGDMDSDEEEEANDVVVTAGDTSSSAAFFGNRLLRHGGGGRDSSSDDGGGNGGRVLMLNADIALVRNFTEFIDEDGVVHCEFENPRNNRPVCPHAGSTIRLAAMYRNDNAQWLSDFRDAFTKMLATGCTDTICTSFTENDAGSVTLSRSETTTADAGEGITSAAGGAAAYLPVFLLGLIFAL